MQLNVLVLPGDGIGVEVTAEAVGVLRLIAARLVGRSIRDVHLWRF
jgi:isocitrate/isopropylmalate dehydrogenase